MPPLVRTARSPASLFRTTVVGVLSSLLLALPAGCAWTWDKVDYCDTGGCDTCQTDDDCVVGASCCSEAFYCMHEDEALTVCMLGCYEPAPPACRCREGRCQF